MDDQKFNELRNDARVKRMMRKAELQRRLEPVRDRLLSIPVDWAMGVLSVQVPGKYRNMQPVMEEVKFFHCIKAEKLQSLTNEFNQKEYKNKNWHPKKYRDNLVLFLNRHFPHKAAFSSQIEYGLYIRKHEKENQS